MTTIPRFLPWITHFTLQITDVLNCFLCSLVAGVATGSLKTQDSLLRSNMKYIYQNLSNLVRCGDAFRSFLAQDGLRRMISYLSVLSQVLPVSRGTPSFNSASIPAFAFCKRLIAAFTAT